MAAGRSAHARGEPLVVGRNGPSSCDGGIGGADPSDKGNLHAQQQPQPPPATRAKHASAGGYAPTPQLTNIPEWQRRWRCYSGLRLPNNTPPTRSWVRHGLRLDLRNPRACYGLPLTLTGSSARRRLPFAAENLTVMFEAWRIRADCGKLRRTTKQSWEQVEKVRPSTDDWESYWQ